ncbi:unnamed protein product [Taenia asiatica]|uniref:Type II toxin-antitoxin system RelE/ParE family toxin n=1 Tax=Taenia asiatica TaxID=60517 RepID=A0A0R3W627_TAEAS|nr:unnamed protein product [Taenia asiatica]
MVKYQTYFRLSSNGLFAEEVRRLLPQPAGGLVDVLPLNRRPQLDPPDQSFALILSPGSQSGRALDYTTPTGHRSKGNDLP